MPNDTHTLLHHGFYDVRLPVTDLARGPAFYCDVPGFRTGFGGTGDASVLLLDERADTRWMPGLFAVEEIRHPHAAGRVHGSFTQRAMFEIARRDGILQPETLREVEKEYGTVDE